MKTSPLLALFGLGILVSLASGLTGQGPPGPAPRVYRDKVDPHWLALTDKTRAEFWYRVIEPVRRR